MADHVFINMLPAKVRQSLYDERGRPSLVRESFGSDTQKLDGLVTDRITSRRPICQVDDPAGDLRGKAKQICRPSSRWLNANSVSSGDGVGGLIVVGAEFATQLGIYAGIVINSATRAVYFRFRLGPREPYRQMSGSPDRESLCPRKRTHVSSFGFS